MILSSLHSWFHPRPVFLCWRPVGLHGFKDSPPPPHLIRSDYNLSLVFLGEPEKLEQHLKGGWKPLL